MTNTAEPSSMARGDGRLPRSTRPQLGRLLGVGLVLLALSCRLAAEDTQDGPPSSDQLEVYHLSDGTKLIGIYDTKTHIFSRYDPDTMEKIGIRGVDPADIVSHKLLVPPAEPAPAHSGSGAAAADHQPGTDGTWIDDYQAAIAAATATKRPIVADFTGSDWCPWCIKLHDEILSTDDFKTWAAKNAVLLVVDFPRSVQQSDALQKQNQELQGKYGIEGFPTVLLLDASGTVIGRNGYQPVKAPAWIDELTKAANLPSH